MELRFLEENGEKKLQIRGQTSNWTYIENWTDVPTVQAEKKVWCEHMKIEVSTWNVQEHSGDGIYVRLVPIDFCPICGTPRPKE